MENQLDYVKAAEIIAKCPKRKMGVVLATLRKAGYEIDYDKELEDKTDKRSSKETIKRKRVGASEEKWIESDNPVTLRLRRAYRDGVNFSELSRNAGLDRATVYKYLWGGMKPSAGSAKCVLEALDAIEKSGKDPLFVV